MKIVILDGSAVKQKDLNFDTLKDFGEVTCYDRTAREQTIERIADAEVVLTNKVLIDKAVLDACKNIRLVCVLATGYNVVDCPYARSKNVVICNVPSYGTDSVAQHTFALILTLCSRTDLHAQSVRGGDWVKSTDFCYCVSPLTELKGKTLGIIGFGEIGRAVKKIAEAFGMRVLVNNRSKVRGGVDKETIYKESDIITLHCPLNEENAKMLHTDAIKIMKKTAFIINTARGGLVDEDAVAKALNEGKIAGFAADVLSSEPPKKDNPLLTAKNCIITPHIAWASLDARSRLLNITKENIKAFLKGKPINVVN